MDAEDFDSYFDGFGGGTQYKQYIDNNLPGGKNYREIIYTYEGADETHNLAHPAFNPEEGNYLAHALVRDRKLADGTETLHGDELQSDLHSRGFKDGYQGTEEHQKLLDIIKNRQPILEEKVKKLKPQYIERIPEINSDPVKQKEIATKLNKLFDEFQNASPEQKTRKILSIKEFDRNVFSPDGRSLSKTYDSLLETESTYLSDAFYKAEDFVPNYPYKDDYHEMLLKKMLLQAVEEGKPAISVSSSAPMVDRYSDSYEEFYKILYDQDIPKSMRNLAKKYGGEFEVGSLDIDNTFGSGTEKFLTAPETGLDRRRNLVKSNVIKITEEMRNKILLEGVPDFAIGGIVNKGIATLRTAKQPTEGIVDLGLY